MANFAFLQPALRQLSFSGGLLARGFWLYVWEITTPGGQRVHYVGRTGARYKP